MSEEKDRRSRSYQLVINNPLERDYSHGKIKEKLASLTSLRYYCMSDEIGLTTTDENGNEKLGTPHTHVYLLGKNQMRFSRIKQLFGEAAHIEECFAKPEANRAYVSKTGKWANDVKHDTSIPGTFEEWGEIPPDNQGYRSDLALLHAQIESGMSTAAILRANPNHLLNIQHIERARSIILQDKFQNEYRLELKEQVNYIQGPTGVGKSRYVYEHHHPSDIYRVTDYKHPFDGYTSQPVIVFDEYRSSLPCGDMLNYLDIYPATMLPARYTQRIACYTTVYMISNWNLEEQYQNVKTESPLTYEAWIRRISKVIEFESENSYTDYTTKEYFDNFRPVKNDVVIPFDSPRQMKLPLAPDDGFMKIALDGTENLPWEV